MGKRVFLDGQREGFQGFTLPFPGVFHKNQPLAAHHGKVTAAVEDALRGMVLGFQDFHIEGVQVGGDHRMFDGFLGLAFAVGFLSAQENQRGRCRLPE